MTTRLAELLDADPPVDTEAERLLLSAAMVDTPSWRRYILRPISADELHDPWHQWLLRAMRCYPTHEGMDFILALRSHPGPEWTRARIGWHLASMIVTRSERDICGDPAHWRYYLDRVRRAAKLRKDYDHGVTNIARILAEAQDCGLTHADHP